MAEMPTAPTKIRINLRVPLRMCCIQASLRAKAILIANESEALLSKKIQTEKGRLKFGDP